MSNRLQLSPEAVELHYQRQGKEVPEDIRKTLEAMGLGHRLRKAEPNEVASSGAQATKKPRKNKKSSKHQDSEATSLPVEVSSELGKDITRKNQAMTQVFHSLRSTQIEAACGEHFFAFWLDGARLLSVNQMISVYQSRKFLMYTYKALSKKLMGRILNVLPKDAKRPYFDGPTRLWVYRSSKKMVDEDSMSTMFKYLIDQLQKEGIIAQDNRKVIVGIRPIQTKGEFVVGMRLEKIPDWVDSPMDNLKEQWLSSKPLDV